MTNSTTHVDERAAIRETIEHYLRGARSGKSDDMRAAFHEQATIFGHFGEELLAAPIEELFAWNDQNGAAIDLQADFAGIDVAGTIATVRLELDNWTGHRFTDMFTLLKIDGAWKIINKVFHVHSPSPDQAES